MAAKEVIEGLVLKLLMAMPDAWKIKMAGGEPLTIAGRTLTPRLQLLAHLAKKQPAFSSLTPVQARAAAAGFGALAGETPTVSIENRTIPGPAGDIPVRIYRPLTTQAKDATLVYYHMGGCVIGDLDTCDNFCAKITDQTNAVVMSVDYRLAPENKCPAALEDAIAAYKWAVDNVGALGNDATRIAVGGDSAGGYLSTAVCQIMKSEDGPQPHTQVLIYPWVDMVDERQSFIDFSDAYPLSAETMRYFMNHYISDTDDKADPRLSPIQCKDFSGLAPAIIATAGFDPLNSEGAEYAEKLKAAGVEVQYWCEDDLCHAFTALGGIEPRAVQANDRIIAALGKRFNG